MTKAIIALVTALPQILKMIQAIQAHNAKMEREQKVKEDVKKIEQAFKNQDANALRDIFNGDASS